jgi:hypothetical protein
MFLLSRPCCEHGEGPGRAQPGPVWCWNFGLGFNADGTIADPVLLDAEKGLEILEAIRINAECDPADPPNECTW